jgi:hypothetical protein
VSVLTLSWVTSVYAQSWGPCPPRVIFQESPWWQPYVPTVVGLVQFLILAFITVFVFWSNSAQKIRERQAEWYHKVVIDHAVYQLKELFGHMQKNLLAAAEQVDAFRLAHMDKAREHSKVAIGDAKKTIFDLRSEMSFRLSAFDPALEQTFTHDLETLENDIVKWFTTQAEKKCYDASASLPEILASGQIRLLRTLMRKEFSTWGFSWPWSRRGSLPPESFS